MGVWYSYGMKFLYAIGLVLLTGASISLAQESFPRPTLGSPSGYSCALSKVSPFGSGGSIFSGTCVRIVRRPTSATSRITPPAPNSPFGTTLAIGTHLYGSDPSNADLMCNNNIVINLLQQCPNIPNFLQYMAIQCVRQKHPDSCGRTNVGDCCLSFPQAVGPSL